jgi:hypothetical protein
LKKDKKNLKKKKEEEAEAEAAQEIFEKTKMFGM